MIFRMPIPLSSIRHRISGLSDFAQMRGRVGRSNKKSILLFVAPPLSSLTPEAMAVVCKLLRISVTWAVEFTIAMQDLDIRGAGNMLGAEQSGFIARSGL